MKKYLALLILFATLLRFTACNSSEEPLSTENITEDIEAGLEENEFLLLDEYSLVCSDTLRSNDTIVEALNYLKEALAACGSKGIIAIDSKEYDREGEIIIGDTSRSQSEQMRQGMKIDDYAYRVESQSEMVICGGSNYSTLTAVKKFCSDVLGYTPSDKDKTSSPVLKVGTEYRYVSDEYKIADFCIGDIPFSDFKIAVARERDIVYADIVIQMLGVYTGYALPVVSFEDLTDEDKGVICIGYYDREHTLTLPAGILGYSVQFSEDDGAITIGIGASGKQNYDRAARKLASVLKPSNDGANLELPKNPISDISYDTDPIHTPLWYLQNEKSEVVSDGVEYREFHYTDSAGNPYRAYALIIDPEKNHLLMGSANDSYDYTTNSPQSVAEHMIAASENGFEVIAGVNADFFAMGGDNHPSGLAIKEGILISKGAAGRPYFALGKDGRAVIGADGSSVDETQLITAVGGSDILVENHYPLSFDMVNNDFNYTAHPRTLAGFRADGSIILAVIDGRQPSVSNGASLERCALFMILLGAKEAINLDGGGSSSVIVNRDGEMTTMNSPSGGVLRRVYNSVIVCKKEQ